MIIFILLLFFILLFFSQQFLQHFCIVLMRLKIILQYISSTCMLFYSFMCTILFFFVYYSIRVIFYVFHVLISCIVRSSLWLLYCNKRVCKTITHYNYRYTHHTEYFAIIATKQCDKYVYCRRAKADLIMRYKILNNLVCIDHDQFLNVLRGNSIKLNKCHIASARDGLSFSLFMSSTYGIRFLIILLHRQLSHASNKNLNC